MPWNSNGGWTVSDVQTQLKAYYEGFKINGYPDLSYSQFEDSREYEVAYMSAQIDASIDSVFSEIFTRLSVYIRDTNSKISNPTTVPSAVISGFWDDFGIRANVKQMTEADRGKLHIALDYSSNPDLVTGPELEYQIGKWLEKSRVVAGVVTVGDIEQTIVIADSVPEVYRWTEAVDKEIQFKTTVYLSRKSSFVVEDSETIAAKFNANFDRLYWVGRDIEPETYLETQSDCPYAYDIVTEFSIDGGTTWLTDPYNANYNEKFSGKLEAGNVTIIES